MTPEELRTARKAMGMTQGQLAQALGYSRTHVVRLERGALPITTVLAWAICGLIWAARQGAASQVASRVAVDVIRDDGWKNREAEVQKIADGVNLWMTKK